jgi:chorismate mutase
MTQDEFVKQIRAQITDTDRAIVDAINKRLELVAALKRYKEENGLPLVDPAREQSMISAMLDANPGPISRDGLERAYRDLLDLTKRELFGNGDFRAR